MDAVDLPPAVQARPCLQDDDARQLVHELQVCAGQRRGRRGRVRALRRTRYPQGKEPVDAAHHEVCRPPDRRSRRRRLHRAREDAAAQLDRPLHRYRGHVQDQHRRRYHRLYHARRYALRRDVHRYLSRAPAAQKVEEHHQKLGRGRGVSGSRGAQERL